MAHTLLKYVALAACTFSAAAGATQSYAVTEVYNATNFFDKFGHFVSVLGKTTLDVDPTSGYVQYLDRDDAIQSGLMSIDGDEVYVGPETSQTYNPYGYGRKSVRLESLSTYNHGLFIADFTHLPTPTCGAWPSFWMFGAPWPTKGEIDILENWNDLEFNRNTAHVDSPDVIGKCTIKSSDMTAALIESHNCYDKTPGQYDNQGCSADSPGLPFGLSEGGVYAVEWTSDYLKIWSWTRALAPLDIQLGHPLPLTWGVPDFMITDCNVDQAFQDMKLVLNIDFCGVAGADGIWDSCKASTGYDTCTGYVAENPEAFKDSYFKIADFKVYEQREDVVTTSSSSSSYTTSTTSSVPSSSSSDVSSVIKTSSGVSTTSSAFSTTSTAFSATSTIISTNASSFLGTTSSISPSSFSSSLPLVSTFDSSSSFEKPTSYNYNSTTATPSISATKISTSSYSASSDKIASATSSSISATISSSSSSYGASTIVGFSNTTASITTTAATELTTSTVYTTRVHTVTSCAPTVTNCPAGSGGEVVVTETIPLYTTVCPVATTASVSTAAASSYSYDTSVASSSVPLDATTSKVDTGAAPSSTAQSTPSSVSSSSGDNSDHGSGSNSAHGVSYSYYSAVSKPTTSTEGTTTTTSTLRLYTTVTVKASSAPSSSPVSGSSPTALSDLVVVVSAPTATLIPIDSPVPVAPSLSDHSVTTSLPNSPKTTTIGSSNHGGDSGSVPGVSVNGSKKTGITSVVGLLGMVAVLMFAM